MFAVQDLERLSAAVTPAMPALADGILLQVLSALAPLVPFLIRIGGAILCLCVVVFLTYSIVVLVCPELGDLFSGVARGMWGDWKSARAASFAESPVGRAYSSYKERAGVHDGASYPVESCSLGPREDSGGGGSFSGYDYGEHLDIVPSDNVDLED